MPHALLDILRGCNVRCEACYNRGDAQLKPVAAIREEVETLLRRRRLHSISVLGGEPLLHPDLFEIIAFLKHKRLRVELFTNGLLLDARVAARLKAAGMDLVFLHIDDGQIRADLPAPHSAAQRQDLVRAKAALLNDAGLESGLAITAYPDRLHEVVESIRFVLESQILGYLLVTRCRQHVGIGTIRGCMETGLSATVAPSLPPPGSPSTRSHQDLQDLLRERFAFGPFAWLGSNRDPHDARWLSYLVGTVRTTLGGTHAESLRASAFERLYMAARRRFSGRYPFFTPWSPILFRLQLLMNAASGGRPGANLRLLLASLHPTARLHAKRILFQKPAEVDAAGRVTHCHDCPDAVVRHGRLVPVCLADFMETPA